MFIRIAVVSLTLVLASTGLIAEDQLPLIKDNALIYAHHHLNVPDIAAAKKFWVDVLGGTPATAGPLQMVKFPNLIIVFTQRAPTGGSKGTTVNHVGFSVPNLRQMLDKVKAAGYPLVTREEMPAPIGSQRRHRLRGRGQDQRRVRDAARGHQD